MDLALAIAKSGLEAQHQNLEIISNNLANASTPSFKKSRAEFEDLPYQVTTLPGSPTTQETNSPAGLVMGTGTKLVGNAKIYTQGSPIETKRDKDMAIQGRGFYQVQLPNGAGFAYTRDGAFSVNESGQLTMGNGYIVQPPITLPQQYSSLSVSTDGIVSATIPGGTSSQIGQLQLADFVNPDGLQPLGGNLYASTTSSGAETLSNPDTQGYGRIVQGYIEGSNVNVVEEMVNLIEAQRAFEVTSKAVSTVDNMMEYLNKEV
ncbi:MAG: flagellar basal-body rod protein FlgG [Gammaproteobacteria bacterium]